MGEFQIRQDYEYQDRDRWRWWVWLDAAPTDLDRVERVTWKLHETFPQPVVVVTNRADNFRLERIGWGTFELRAEIELGKDGKLELRHTLELAYPESAQRERRARSDKPKVFLSYAAEDVRIAGRVRDQLREAGYSVVEAQDLKAGLPWAVALRDMLRSSDALVSVMTASVLCDSIRTELEEARKAKLPVFVLLKRGVKPEATLATDQVLEFDAKDLERSVADALLRVKIMPR